ncbi:MAG: hypothetical protein NTW21_39900 [Verrucomicrobia bacterium]|nr:hypothetical protein [Verrucomicrobiota bacterium]
MAYQLVYTSATKLLDAGRSGLGTVARSKAIAPLVVSAIERVSQFDNSRGLDGSRVIHVHRRITAGSHRFHLLTRIVAAGSDYTARNNHLAHHLVVPPEEAARAAALGITPAEVLRQFQWLGRWEGHARFFEPAEDVPIDGFVPEALTSGRHTWLSLTGNPAHARLLAWEGAPRTGVIIVPAPVERLRLLAEALVEFGPQSWSRSFTTSLEATDDLAELAWIVTTPGGFGEIQTRCASRTVFDLTRPETLPIPPGRETTATPQVATGAPRREASGNQRPSGSIPNTRGTAPSRVAVAIAATGAATKHASLRSAASKAARKTQLMLLAGVVVFLIAAALVVSAIFKGHNRHHQSTDNSTVVAPAPGRKLTATQTQALYELRNLKIAESEALKIVEKAGPDCGSWTQFIIGSNRLFRDLSDPRQPARADLQLPPLPDPEEIPGAQPWTGELVDLVRTLGNLKNVESGKDWDDQVAKVGDQIRIIRGDGGLPAVSGDHAQVSDALFLKLAEPHLEQLLQASEKGQLDDFLSTSNCWKSDSHPARYDLLARKIKDWLSQAAAGGPQPKERYVTVLSEIDSHKAWFKDDYKGLKKAWFLFNEGTPSADHLAALETQGRELIRKSALVPDAIKQKLDRPGAHANRPATGNATALAINAPPKQAILVTREQLNTGVRVELLKALMTATLAGQKPDKIELGNLATIVDAAEARETTALFLTDEKTYYCRTRKTDDSAPKYFADGKFALANNQAMTARFSYPEHAPQHETWIVVDAPAKTGICPDLKYQIELAGETLRLSGTLAEWIKSVTPADKDLRLIITHDARTSDPVETALSIAEATTGLPPDWPMPSPAEKIFPLRNAATLQKQLEEIRAQFANYLEMPTSKPLERKLQQVQEDELKLRCPRLVSDLVETIGATVALRLLMLDDINLIKADNTIIDELKKTPNFDPKEIQAQIVAWQTASNMKPIEEEIRKLPKGKQKEERKKRVGGIKDHDETRQRTEFFTVLGESVLIQGRLFGLNDLDSYRKLIADPINTFEKEVGIESAMESAITLIDKVLKVQVVPIAQRRKAYLASIQTLRVLTPKGRVLFEATRTKE